MSSKIHDSISELILEKLPLLPNSPGVYLMKSGEGKVIYIGKALNLRNRVRGYFMSSGGENHLASHVLRTAAKDMEWIITQNEIEALILEANLAKKYTPKYNIELKDDKHYPYIRVTTSEPFPRLWVTRQVSKGADLFFGPYTNAKAMRKTIQFLNRTFRIRDCDLKLPVTEPVRPCLSFHIGRCDAPCAHLIEALDYRKLVDDAVLLLKGKRLELNNDLEAKMHAAAEKKEYESAGRIRDQLQALESVQERQRVDLGVDQQPRDLIAVRREGKLGSVIVLEIRDGYLSDRKQFEVSVPLEQDESAILTGFLKTYYLNRSQGEIPSEVLLSHAPVLEENMEELLRALKNGVVDLSVPQRGEKRKQMEIALANAAMQLTEYLARNERKYRQNYAVKALQEELGLLIPPKRIEGYDISHLSGTDTVASRVVFKDGLPAKKEYRHYHIKTVKGIDDFASMHEVISRRLRSLSEKKEEGPDLILIDGGKGQLHSACKALKEFHQENIPILGLAKRLEEIFVPHQNEPILLPKSSAALRLLQQVRDEAHRFAITFQRKQRKSRLTDSWLDGIVGIGSKTKMKLLAAFATPVLIQSASEVELSAVVGKAVTKKILAAQKV